MALETSPSRTWLFWVYEAFMAGLALAVVWLLTEPEGVPHERLNLVIWAVFVVDYVVGLARAHDRRQFVRGHVPELVAILPLDFLRVARLARLARFVRLLRVGSVLWRVTRDVRGVLGTNGLGYVLAFAASVIVGGAVLAWNFEDRLDSLADSLWWAIVTATTVGYGDIAPASGGARGVAVGLMLVGIGTLGMITGSIATFFLGRNRDGPRNEQVDWIREQLERWDELEPTERRRLARMLEALADTD